MTRRQPRSPRASPRLIRDRRTSAPTWGRGRASGQARRTAPLPRNADHGRRGDDGQTLAAEHLPEEDGERGKQDRRQHKAVPEKLEMNPARLEAAQVGASGGVVAGPRDRLRFLDGRHGRRDVECHGLRKRRCREIGFGAGTHRTQTALDASGTCRCLRGTGPLLRRSFALNMAHAGQFDGRSTSRPSTDSTPSGHTSTKPMHGSRWATGLRYG
jgi:hypothetical protein